MKLLNEKELKREIRTIFENDDSFHSAEASLHDKTTITNNLIELIQDQKIAHANNKIQDLLVEISSDLYEIADQNEPSTKVWKRHGKYLDKLADLLEEKQIV